MLCLICIKIDKSFTTQRPERVEWECLRCMQVSAAYLTKRQAVWKCWHNNRRATTTGKCGMRNREGVIRRWFIRSRMVINDPGSDKIEYHSIRSARNLVMIYGSIEKSHVHIIIDRDRYDHVYLFLPLPSPCFFCSIHNNQIISLFSLFSNSCGHPVSLPWK